MKLTFFAITATTIVGLLAQVAPTDPTGQFVANAILQLGVGGSLAIVLLKIRKEDRDTAEKNRDADRAQIDRLIDKFLDVSTKSNEVANKTVDVTERRRERVKETNEVVLDRLEEVLNELEADRADRKRRKA